MTALDLMAFTPPTVSATTVAVMVVVCGIVWGGLVALLVRAVRREGRSRDR